MFKRGTNKNDLYQAITNLVKVKRLKELDRPLTIIEINTLIKCNSLADKYISHVR